MSFLLEKQKLVDNVFAEFGEPCRIFFGGIAETVTGIYKNPQNDYSAGDLTVVGNSPTLRVRNVDIRSLEVKKGTQVEVNDITFQVKTPPRVQDDGTTYLDLKEA